MCAWTARLDLSDNATHHRNLIRLKCLARSHSNGQRTNANRYNTRSLRMVHRQTVVYGDDICTRSLARWRIKQKQTHTHTHRRTDCAAANCNLRQIRSTDRVRCKCNESARSLAASRSLLPSRQQTTGGAHIAPQADDTRARAASRRGGGTCCSLAARGSRAARSSSKPQVVMSESPYNCKQTARRLVLAVAVAVEGPAERQRPHRCERALSAHCARAHRGGARDGRTCRARGGLPVAEPRSGSRASRRQVSPDADGPSRRAPALAPDGGDGESPLARSHRRTQPI